MFKKVLFVAVVMMMFVVSCAGNIAVEIADDFDSDFGAEIQEALNLPDEVTVTKRVNGDTVYSERFDHDDFDNNRSHRFDNDSSLEIDDVSDIDWHFGEGGMTFELKGTNREGEAVTISADLTEGKNSTVNIDVSE